MIAGVETSTSPMLGERAGDALVETRGPTAEPMLGERHSVGEPGRMIYYRTHRVI